MVDEIGEKENSFLAGSLDELTMNGIDVGCGQRKLFDCAIGIDVARYVKTDLSAPDVCRANWIGTGELLPFKDNVLDYVVSRHALEHMDWKVALSEWIRCLKKGGVLAVVVPDPKCINHRGHGVPIVWVVNELRELGMFITEAKTVYVYEDTPYSWGIRALKK